MIPRRTFIAAAACATAGSPPLAWAQADDYPARPILIVANSEAGGATDIVARALQERLRAALGTQHALVIENQSAAGGVVGAEKVARSRPDGYTLLISGAGPVVFAPLLSTAVRYDPARDFQPVALIATAPNLLVAVPKLGVQTLAELTALAKQKPGVITYGSSGLGNPSHLAGEFYQQLAGVKLLHVPYRGSRQAATALLAGEVDVMFSPPSATAAFVQDGRLRGIAVTSPDRIPQAPQVPTSAEAGLRELEVLGWFGLLGPAGLPARLVQKLNAAMNSVLADPAVREAVSRAGFDAVAKSAPETFASYVAAERTRWKRVIDTAGIKVE
jgi:tripartite-type tricarboxylate transporter receptor subunit TctC